MLRFCLLLLLWMFTFSAYSQNDVLNKWNTDLFSSYSLRYNILIAPNSERGKISVATFRSTYALTSNVSHSKPLYFEPFFCRIERLREHQSGMGLKFRLGTVDYTDMLEGKSVKVE